MNEIAKAIIKVVNDSGEELHLGQIVDKLNGIYPEQEVRTWAWNLIEYKVITVTKHWTIIKPIHAAISKSG